MYSEAFFERIANQYEAQLPFVAYRKPNSPKLNLLLQEDDVLHVAKTFSESGFVFSPFDADESTVLIPFRASHSFQVDYSANATKTPQPLQDTDLEADKAKHIALVKKGMAAINGKQFEKVVLSRKETVAIDNANPLDIVKQLLSTYPLAFVYCWYHPKVGLWLGATPETLLKIEGNRFTMMSLAGTQVYNGTTNVVWQDKELKEQQIVTDFIVAHLKPLINTINISETETVRAGNLLHLKTMVTAQLKPEASHLKQLIFDLHPTPAVCGMPKQAAKKFILEHEHYNRDFYTGFLGELNLETTRAPRTAKKNIENRAYA